MKFDNYIDALLDYIIYNNEIKREKLPKYIKYARAIGFQKRKFFVELHKRKSV